MVRKLLNRTQIDCLCEQTILYEKILIHFKTCDNFRKSVPCALKCGGKIFIDGIKSHFNNDCEMVQVQCQCSEKFQKN